MTHINIQTETFIRFWLRGITKTKLHDLKIGKCSVRKKIIRFCLILVDFFPPLPENSGII